MEIFMQLIKKYTYRKIFASKSSKTILHSNVN